MTSRRDPFLDGLRAISVLRVISLHFMQRVEHPLVAAFSFLMPGMPLMFFVSGALAAKSLGKPGAPEELALRARFWRERARRLLFPFWAFALVVVATCVAGALFRGGADDALPLRTLWAWVLPLVGPQASQAYDRLDWHLWFLSSLMLLLASAPWMVKLHRRVPLAGAFAFFAAGAAIELFDLPAPGVVRNTLLFGSAFQLGFAYADGRVQRVPASTLVAAAFCLGAFALAFYFRRAPGAMLHAVPLALVALGMAFVALWLAVRETVEPFFARSRPLKAIRAINGRAYTLYLWGPVANEIAWWIVRPASGLAYALDLALSIVLLIVLVKLFGRVEDWAAKRKKDAKAPIVAPSIVPAPAATPAPAPEPEPKHIAA